MSKRYGNELTLRDARQRYSENRGFGDKLKAGPIALYFPNTKARVRAVKLHDLHHVLTEYDTTWRGEAEIGAWLINLSALAVGLAIAPRPVYRALCAGGALGITTRGSLKRASFRKRRWRRMLALLSWSWHS